MREVVVFGGYGTFGTQVSRALAAESIPVTIAGRDAARVSAAARELGPAHDGLAIDLSDAAACRQALAGRRVAVNCAGPFWSLGTTLLDACLEAGCHYVDITDDRRYAGLVRSYDEPFRRRGLSAVYGCSSLPGISGALALSAAAELGLPVERVRVTLFIGNDNPKGSAAVRSLLAGLGRPIEAPQGTLRGFAHREVVPLPEPFGHRAVFDFESPEYDLFPAQLGARAVSVKVGFELRLANYLFATLGRLGTGYGERMARILERAGSWLPPIGCSGGAVMAELFSGDQTRRAALVARQDGQRMAALPCAFVVQELLRDRSSRHGAMTAYEFLGADGLLERLQSAGFELHRGS